MPFEHDPLAGSAGPTDLTGPVGARPVDRRRFVAGTTGLAAFALLGGCAGTADQESCWSTTRIGVKGRRLESVPCPEA